MEKLESINKAECPRCVSINQDKEFRETFKRLYEKDQKEAFQWLNTKLIEAKDNYMNKKIANQLQFN